MLQGARDERGRLARYRSIVMPNLDKSGVQPGGPSGCPCRMWARMQASGLEPAKRRELETSS